MWAGGSFTWPSKTDSNRDRHLRINNQVVEKRQIAKIEHKTKGDMIFIHQERNIYNNGLEDQEDKWGVKEIRIHVFRPPPSSTSPSSPNSDSTTSTSALQANRSSEIGTPKPYISFLYTPSTPLLFRYSALTFNAHRIHYDHPHTLSLENQPTLLVHGPLTATLLIELAVQAGKEKGMELVKFEYRATGAVFVDLEVEMLGWWDGEGGMQLESRQEGRVGMRASAVFA
jgi:hydroxyacyl-ACP dehydratase HTD2-like protein with hotdog domain